MERSMFSVRWHPHQQYILKQVNLALMNKEFVDVTIFCAQQETYQNHTCGVGNEILETPAITNWSFDAHKVFFPISYISWLLFHLIWKKNIQFLHFWKRKCIEYYIYFEFSVDPGSMFTIFFQIISRKCPIRSEFSDCFAQRHSSTRFCSPFAIHVSRTSWSSKRRSGSCFESSPNFENRRIDPIRRRIFIGEPETEVQAKIPIHEIGE